MRIPGCESTNHTDCYEDDDLLWQCANCKRWFCCGEGTDNDSHLCDDCWVTLKNEFYDNCMALGGCPNCGGFGCNVCSDPPVAIGEEWEE